MTYYLIIKSIFCPDDTQFDLFVDSMVKIDVYLKMSKTEYIIDLLLIGYASVKQRNKIDTFIKLFNKTHIYHSVQIIYWSINYGKYHLINEIVKMDLSNYQLLIYLDHDIYFLMEGYDIMQPSFYQMFSQLLEKESIGLYLLNQLMDCRHQNSIYENYRMHQSYKLCWADDTGSFATGSFITTPSILTNLHPLPLISVYGMDDIYLIRHYQNIGYQTVVIQNRYIIHPFDKNYQYREWKYRLQKNIVDMLEKYIDINYYQTIQDANNFWIQSESSS
jgi:hypothetical protein